MKDIRRRLYKGGEGSDASYVIGATEGDKELFLRLYDVVGGDALVFLTDARALKLIADLQRAMAARKGERL